MSGISVLKGGVAAAALVLTAAGAVGSQGSPLTSVAADDIRPVAASSPWELTFRDDFTGQSINTNNWTVYEQNTRRRENTIVRDGKLILRTKRGATGWSAAGVTNAKRLKQVYGKYVIRARFDRGYGIRAVALLWPTGGVWPPEVNFFEIDAIDADRTTNNLTNHYSPENRMIHREYQGDFTAWHNIGVAWTPQALRFTLDGQLKATITEQIPTREMWLGLQTAAGGISARPGAQTPDVVDFEVDWVKAFRYTGAR